MRRSTEISFKRGRLAGPIATSRRRPAYAKPTPSTPPIKPSIRLSTSRLRTMRATPAPNAARRANSCCRASARISSRLVTLPQAMSSTSAMVPITTHKTSPTLPTTCCFSGRIVGRILQFSYHRPLVLGPFDQVSIQTGNSRARSALACARVTPALSLPMPLNPKPARITRPRSKASGRIKSGSALTTRNPRGMTPAICRGHESTVRFRPMTDRSPPK